jgi:hypothetical protein
MASCTAAIAVVLACAPPSTPPAPDPEVIEGEDRRARRDRDRIGPLAIPEIHLPEPGQCRVWYPGRPVGEQPAQQGCNEAEASAPPATWVLYRPPDDKRVVHARIIHPERPGVVIRIDLYDGEKGTYLGTKELETGAP